VEGNDTTSDVSVRYQAKNCEVINHAAYWRDQGAERVEVRDYSGEIGRWSAAYEKHERSAIDVVEENESTSDAIAGRREGH
jgi:hypothetical protein